jgi:hypothetical protein
MGAITFGIPKELVIELKNIFKINDFIETGTFKGGTTYWASKIFKNVFTVEYSSVLYKAAVLKLSNCRNVTCYFGNSPSQLPQIISQLNSPAIFWLDAHWCGGSTYGVDDECPLLEEISLIIEQNENHIIIIDDARLFLKPPSKLLSSDQWPGLNEILCLLLKRPDFYTFVSEDVIVSIPNWGKSNLKTYFNKIHETEFPGGGILSNLRFALRNILRKWR